MNSDDKNQPAPSTPTPAAPAQAPTPNDQRSNVMNPNNPAFNHNQNNRANQLNPNHAPTKGGGKKK
jgi:hypothetical protein